MLFFNYRRTALLIIAALLSSFVSFGQAIAPTKMDEAILSISDRTYVSFGQGLGNYRTPYGIKLLNPLVFEGQASPDFILKLSKKRNAGLAFFPKIVIRMFHEGSVPVRTPSYMPSILLYHQIDWPVLKKPFRFFIAPENQLTFITYRLIHHSNGQNGDYLIQGTDSINYINGNFSSNAAEIAFSWSAIDSSSAGKAFMNGRIAYERQLDFEREGQMKNSYYYNKLTAESHIIYSEKIKIYATYSFMWGTKQFGTRNSLDVFLVMKPYSRLANFSVFIRGYVGPDYYNLYYENMLRTCTIGIIADPLSIPRFRKEKKILKN
ncbi:MAG TPA: hypothetical protein VGC65_10990 [Bacteroidia bacterium]|jgi:hypothetical protein